MSVQFGLPQPDRWLCPTCQRTEVAPRGSDAVLHYYIVRAQQLHAHRHATERHLPTAGAR